ncbi:hypothetical protein [Oxynema aestuarii]|uniref:hypothetical protein n=1 Tax=Oxynema aestuarii TaxID=2874213 RepID=UPI001B306D03|nr:hypothetical protein [Oxynema aestuarii]
MTQTLLYMSFAIFDSNFYLENNPDVRAAIAAGTVGSALAHFTQFGLNEGRVSVSPLYSEAFYLQNYPDVADAVTRGVFSSGLQHFIQSGEAEGRTRISPFYDEQTYLDRNPDLIGAISNGIISSGLQHYLNLGRNEGRLGGPVLSTPGAGFDEDAYLTLYPDVADAVARGAFASGRDHYERFGQFEATRAGLFFGSNGNDVVRGFGANAGIVGVDFDNLARIGEASLDGRPVSLGVGEIDTLIGSAGSDFFNLGVGTSPANPTPASFYVGNGDGDFAIVRNFDPQNDFMLLANRVDDYRFAVDGGNLRISTSSGDLVAIVEGAQNIGLADFEVEPNTFVLGGRNSIPAIGNFTSGFNEGIYLAVNGDVATAVREGRLSSGLQHYQQSGQAEGRVGVFTGTSTSDRVEAFGSNTTVIGVGLQLVQTQQGLDVVPRSLGNGEVDTLIGGSGTDLFVLSPGVSPANPDLVTFYTEAGDRDFAQIEQFEVGRDRVQLGGTPQDYSFQVANGNFNIFTAGGDLVGVVAGVIDLEPSALRADRTFLLS